MRRPIDQSTLAFRQYQNNSRLSPTLLLTQRTATSQKFLFSTTTNKAPPTALPALRLPFSVSKSTP
jgi:hypothetical protein